RHRAQRVAEVLVRPALHHVVTDAELLGERPELAELHDHADRAGQRPRRGDDQARGGRDVISTRRGDVPERGDHGLHLAQSDDLLVDLLRRCDAADGRVDPDHDRDDLRVLAQRHERFAERLRIADLAAELDDGNRGPEPNADAARTDPLHDGRHTDQREPDPDEQDEPSQPGTPLRHRRPDGSGLALVARFELLAHDVGEGELAALALALEVGVDLVTLLAAAERLDRKRDALLAGIDLRHLGFDFVADLVERSRTVHALGRELRDVDQALDALFDLHEHAEVGDAGDRATHAYARGIPPRHGGPRVFGQLLDTERDALVVDVDAEHHRFDVVALLEELRGVLDLLGPVEVGDVDQAVDALGELDEEPEVGDALHLAADAAAHGMVDAYHLPRVGLGLLEPERHAAVHRVDVEDLDLDLLPNLEHLRGVRHALRPGHLGHVDQAFEARLELDERAVVGERHDLALDATARREAVRHRVPRIGLDLLHAERHALTLRIVLEHDDLHLVADVDDL